MKTKKCFPLLMLSVLFWFTNGCGVYTNIVVNTDTATDFSKYKTFAWLPDDADTSNSPYNNEIIRNNLKNYFGISFSERGYMVNLDKPDLLLQISITNKQKELTIVHPRPYYFCRYYYRSDYYSPYSFDYYYHDYFYCYPSGYYTQKISYVEGSITLNVIDREQNKLIWSGTAKGDVYDPAYINRSIHPAVIGIMKKFPVKPLNNQKKRSNEDNIVLTNKTI